MSARTAVGLRRGKGFIQPKRPKVQGPNLNDFPPAGPSDYPPGPIPDQPQGDPFFLRPDITVNPYPEFADFSGRQVTQPGGIERYPSPPTADMRNQMNVPDLQQRLIEQIRAGNYHEPNAANLPDVGHIANMQAVLDQIRAQGGIHYGTPGTSTSLGQRGMGTTPMSLAMLLRRNAMRGRY